MRSWLGDALFAQCPKQMKPQRGRRRLRRSSAPFAAQALPRRLGMGAEILFKRARLSKRGKHLHPALDLVARTQHAVAQFARPLQLRPNKGCQV